MSAGSKPIQRQRGVLALEDGTRFEGWLFGAPLAEPDAHVAYGEAVFNTSLAGYQEILTDPSYKGQILCMTAPHIGNTGVNTEDEESPKIWAAGLVVRAFTAEPSNFRSQDSLDAYLKKHGIPAISGVDTRALTRHLRKQGVVRGVLLRPEQNAEAYLKKLPPFEGRDLISEVSTAKKYVWPAQGKARFKVAALDYGVKHGLLRELAERGCELTVYPALTSAKEILAAKPDGIFLSNGPGDPEAEPRVPETVRELVGKAPLFGVCMGHQVLALSQGARTYKLKFGHRGGNQPVQDLQTTRVEISSHNHGYAVEESSLPSRIRVTHRNLNDKTIEGLEVVAQGAPAFSVQYHPEACPGPHDSAILFERFLTDMQRWKDQK